MTKGSRILTDAEVLYNILAKSNFGLQMDQLVFYFSRYRGLELEVASECVRIALRDLLDCDVVIWETRGLYKIKCE